MKIFISFILFLLFVSFSSSLIQINENEPQDILLSKEEMRNFVFYSNFEFLENESIILTFDPPSDYIDPGRLDVYILKYQDFNTSHYDMKCTVTSFYGCIFEVPNLEKKSNALYFSLNCISTKCQYRMRLTHKQEIHLSYNKIERFTFQRTSAELFNMTIPAQDQFLRIILSIKYIFLPLENDEFFGEHHNVVLSVGEGRKYKFADQQIVVLNNNESDLSYNCNISALVICAINSTIEIQAFLYTSMNNLELNKYYIDFVFFNKNNEYVLELENDIFEDQNFSLIINFNSLTGSRKTLYFDVDQNPQSLSEFRWKSSIMNSFYEETDLIITKEELNNMGLIGKKYFIIVEGDTQGVFSLLLTHNNNKMLPLFLGSMQSGLIANDEVVNYEIKLWKSHVDIEELTLSATIITGHLNLYGRKCSNYIRCKAITKEDINNDQEIDFKSIYEGVSSLTFTHECHGNYCFYVFALMGKSLAASHLTKYDLILKKQLSFINLIENICYESQINSKEHEQFKLFVEDLDDEIIAVNFFINTELQFLVGKEKICPSEQTNCIQKDGNLYNPVSFEVEEFEPHISLNGTYYIIVFGLKSSEFIFFPEVIRKNNTKAFVQLMEGKSLTYFLSISKKVAYFEFLVDLEEETTIDINLQTNDVYHLTIYLQNDGTIPNGNNFLMSSSNNHLMINHNTFSETIYKVAIESKYYLYSYKNYKIDFSIMYSTAKTLQHIESNQPFYDTIKSNTRKNFLYYVDLNNTIIYVSNHIINPTGAEEMFSMRFSMFMPLNGLKYPNYTTRASTIKLEQSKLTSLCQSKYSANFKDKCPIYISVNNDNEYDVQYIITVRALEYSIQIRQGKEQAIKINDEEKNVLLYFIPANRVDSLEIYIYSLHLNFDLLIKIYNNNKTHPSQYWEYPNETNFDFKFFGKRRISTLLKNKDFADCWPNCVILFNITEKNKQIAEENSSQEKIINILITGDLMEINENKPIQVNSNYHTYKYFLYNLKIAIDQKLALSIDMTNYVGLTEMYFNVNEGSDGVFPTTEVYDFFSIDGHLILSFSEIMKKKVKVLNSTTETTLLIGTYCINTLCESSLTVRMIQFYSGSSIRKVLHGHPYEFYISNQTVQIFEYYHYTNKSFQIKINKELGKGSFSLTSCFNKSVSECIDFADKSSKWSLRTETISIPNNESSAYCLNCYYEIIIKTNDSTNLKGSLNVVLEDEYLILSDGHAFFDFVEENKENKYICKAPSSEELEIDLSVFTNEPELYISKKNHINRNKFEFKAIKQKGHMISAILDPNPAATETEEVYIIVYGKTESKYSIKCRFKSSFSVLHAGLMEFAELKALSSHKYVFYSNEEEIYQNDPRLAIYYSKNITSALGVIIRTKNLNTHHGETPFNQNWEIKEKQTVYSFHALTYDLFNRSAFYEITITNLLFVPINYSISIETNDINILPFDSILNFALMANKWNYYESFIPNKGIFTLDLIECLRSIEVYTTDSYEKLLRNEFDQEYKTFAGQNNLKVFKVNKGKFYFALKSSEGQKDDLLNMSYVQLSTHFYDSYDEIPQYRVGIADDGKLEWFHNQNGKTIIGFQNVFCQFDCDEPFLKAVTIDYKIVASQYVDLVGIRGKCDIISVQEHNFKEVNFVLKELKNQELLNMSKLITTELDINLEKNYYVTIIANVNGIESDLPILLYYKNTEIEKINVKIERAYAYGVILVSLFLIALFAFCGCYYCGGYTKLKNKLKYEIKEVENVSSITSLNTSIEMKSTKLYQGLVEQVN